MCAQALDSKTAEEKNDGGIPPKDKRGDLTMTHA